VGFGSTGFRFMALKLLSISQATLLVFTNPIFTSLLAFICIRERVTIYDIIASLVSFVGVFLVVQGDLKNSGNEERQHFNIAGVVCALIAAFFSSCVYVMLRKIGKKTHYMIPPFYFGAGAGLLSIPVFLSMDYIEDKATYYGDYGFLLLLGAGVAGYFAQMFSSLACQEEKAGRVASVNYLQVLYTYLIDIFWFGMGLTTENIIGASLILFGNVFISGLKCAKIIK